MFVRSALRELSRNFTRLKLTKRIIREKNPVSNYSRHLSTTPKRFQVEENFRSSPDSAESTSIPESEGYRNLPHIEKDPPRHAGTVSRNQALQLLSDELLISRHSGEKIFQKESRLRYLNADNFRKVVELIQEFKITPVTVQEFPWILAMQSHILRTKLETITQMNPRNIDDFVPLMRVSNFRLTKILCVMENETAFVPGGNRIYYIANKLDLQPQIVSKYISTRLFMLEIPAQTLIGNLDAMLKYGVAPLSIIRDLWAFRYNTNSIIERLERAKRAQKEKLMPWMIRCPEPILQKSLQLSLDERKILGQDEDVYDYLSFRLGYDIETTKAIVMKHPAVAKVRVTKIKEVLDYLFNEAGFTRHDVAKVPRILSHGLATTKHRLDELKSYGCIPSSLVIVCRSQREYDKFLTQWIQTRDKIKTLKKTL